MEKVIVWYGAKNAGDGSYVLYWFLTEEEAQRFDEKGEGCELTGNVETFVGSDIHQEALENVNFDEEITELYKTTTLPREVNNKYCSNLLLRIRLENFKNKN